MSERLQDSAVLFYSLNVVYSYSLVRVGVVFKFDKNFLYPAGFKQPEREGGSTDVRVPL